MLLMLSLVVAGLSIGLPRQALEAVGGIGFSRPAVSEAPLPPPRADTDLQARLESAGAISSGHLAVTVLDLEGGAMAALDGDRAMPAASLFKLPILIEVLAQQHVRRLDPDRLVEVRPEDWTDGSGLLQARVGERFSVRDLTRLMIQESDNIAALVLLSAVGSDNVNSTLDRLGLSGTRVVDRRRGEVGEHVTTARDSAKLLSLIAAGQFIDADVSEQALRLLELKQANTWLAEDLPWWVKVAHKWGDLPEARHDAGVVFTPRGAFVAAILTEGVPPDEARRAIARIARAAYDYLGSARRDRSKS